MSAIGILVYAACLMSECLSVNPASNPTSPQASQTSPTNIGSSTSNSAIPSLLLSLLNAYSSSSSASSSSPSSSQTGSSTQEITNQSSSSIPLPSSNQISATQSSTVPAFTNLLSPSSMTQNTLREWVLLTSNQHAPFNMALAGLPPQDMTYEVLSTLLLLKTANLLDCTSVGEIVGGEEMAYVPMNCRGMCHRGTTCVMVKSIGFCCPRTECLSVNPASTPTSPQASQTPPTNIGSSTSNGANPSLLLSLLNAYSPSSAASSSSPSTSQTGSSTQEITNQSSSSIPLPSSNQISATQSSTVPAFTNLLSPSSMTQTALREWALLTSNRHAPFNMALVGLPPQDMTYEVLSTLLLLKTANLLDCTSVGEIVGGDEMAYVPMNCQGMCPRGTKCVMVKSIGFCCPRRANNIRLPWGAGRK